MVRYVLVIIALLVSSFPLFAHVGLADWGCTTPGGNEISNYRGGIALYLKTGWTIEGLNKWYFYKSHIICVNNENKLFIVDERTGVVDSSDAGYILSNRNSSVELLKQKHLEPKIWTRWYDSDWETSLVSNFPLFLIFGFYIAIPLLILYFWLWYKAIRQKLSINKAYPRVVYIITGLVLINYLFDVFPQSI